MLSLAHVSAHPFALFLAKAGHTQLSGSASSPGVLWSMHAPPAPYLAGWVRMQVQRIAARGSLPTRAVHIPGAIVDKVAILTTCASF